MKIEELQARYPFVKLTEKSKTIEIATSPSSSFNIDKDDEKLEENISYYNQLWAYANLLQAQYPYLYIGTGTVPGLKNPRWEDEKPFNWAVWIRRIYKFPTRTETVSGASMRYSFIYPPTEYEQKELVKMNEIARQASQEGYFYCTNCGKALPKEEYGGFWFADVRCKKCANPEWKRAAERETYD